MKLYSYWRSTTSIRARAALNWEKHFELSFDPELARAYHDEDLSVDTDFCAMCGHDWCSVRISKEIVEFISGKDEAYAWDKPKVTDALTPEQRQILEQRGAHGVLDHQARQARLQGFDGHDQLSSREGMVASACSSVTKVRRFQAGSSFG